MTRFISAVLLYSFICLLGLLFSGCAPSPKSIAKQNHDRISRITLNQSIDEVIKIMGKGPESITQRLLENGTPEIIWYYLTDRSNEINTTISFRNRRVSSINRSSWEGDGDFSEKGLPVATESDSFDFKKSQQLKPSSTNATLQAGLVSTNRTGDLIKTSESRVALVIGNSHYQGFGDLINPANDARDMSSTLARLGFSVSLLIDAGQEDMETAIADFGRKLIEGGVGLFYYAGHGVQVDGRNFLIPTGAAIDNQKEVRYKAVDPGQVLDEMDNARSGLNIVLLDACRDNPLPRSTRSGLRGLTRLDAAKGTFIAFATSPGSVAFDGDERNGVFTKHILQDIQIPGLTLEQVFKKVIQGVDQETNGQQTPWSSSSFTGEFYFLD